MGLRAGGWGQRDGAGLSGRTYPHKIATVIKYF